MEALPIPGTYIIRDLHIPNSGLYDIQWCPPYKGGDSDLELFLEAHSELSDDTGWRADIQEDYPDYIPGSTFGEPEKILAECWVPKNGINDDLNHLCGQWFLTKYEGYPLVLSRWRRLAAGDDFYLHREYPVREAWEEEKKRYQEGKSKPFDLQWYNGVLIEKDKIKAQRAGLRRFRRTLEFIQGVLEAEQLDANEDSIIPTSP